MKLKVFKSLYIRVLLGVAFGILTGALAPMFASELKPLGDVFVRLIKMVFAPVIFATVVLGIARMESMKELGRVGLRALIYFEIFSTFALALGLIIVNILQPGAGMNVDPTTLDTHSIANLTTQQRPSLTIDFLLQVFPNSAIDAFARNDILQILTFSIFIGVALSHLGERAKPFVSFLDSFAHAMFRIVGMVMRYAPVAAFGAVAFIIGEYGFHTLTSLGKLLACMYLTCALFVVVILGPVARFAGFSLWKLLKYIKDEIFTLLGTASSESVVPQIMRKMENIGVSKSVVGLMVPSGLTFNPDGQCIYYTMAAIFIAQATNTPLTLTDQLIVLVVLLLTSKGSAGISGSAFITLAATLSSLGKIPVAGMVLLLGVDMFMAQARSITNTIGNSVATLVVGKWVGALDQGRAQEVLNHELTPEELKILYES